MNRLATLFASLALAAGNAAPSLAASFEVAVLPSRFELETKSAARVGRSVDIYNVGSTATEVSVRTLDWSYSEDGRITYHDALQPDSCRPLVTLERKTLKVAPRSKAAFRIQVDVPADAPRGECRLMLAVEGIEPAYQATIAQGGMNLSLPVSGRIAVAIYVAINGAEPKLSVGQVAMKTLNGRPTPVVTVTNAGDAHGRLEGSLDAVDAKGVAFELIPEGTPVLPGQTRTLPLLPKGEASAAPKALSFPVKASGSLDWDKGSFKINAQLR
ncbi:MAG: hypothetical protein EOP82_08455 [Variovorax sp.]|nr:MAG: hypothetical protein EOP82_08455 [Variovorax sp.]